MKIFNRSPYSMLAVLAAMAAVAPAYALDTDVYLKSQIAAKSGQHSQPNVMIILDNSGSMNSTVPATRPAYDPTIDYCADDLDAAIGSGTNAGKPSGCASISGRLYFSISGTPPSYSSDAWFASGKNKCFDSTSAFTDTGRYGSTKIAMWLNNRNWRSLNGKVDSDMTYVDCEADATANGQTLGDNQFPRNSKTNAYTGTSTQAFNWANFTTDAYPTLFSANYMNYWHNSAMGQPRTRIDIAKDAVIELINANKNVRFGLTIFNNNTDSDSSSNGRHGGRVVDRIDDANDGRRLNATNIINSIVANTWTPLAETMWEVYTYLSGNPVYYGDNDPSAVPARDFQAEANNVYKSPMLYACQKAFVILVTDGDPTIDTNANALIKAKTGVNNCDANSATANSCLDSLSGWMHDNDINDALPGKQTVVTYTIGFGGGISAQGLALLKATANKGGGIYTQADQADQLNSALQGYINQILSQTSSFTAPSLAINAFNRQYNNDDVYLSIFLPDNSCAWRGNLKKYRLCKQTDISAGRCSNLSQVLDQNNVLITDVNNNIIESAQSFWSNSTDGSTVDRGGAGEHVHDAGTRKMYTFYGSYAGSALPSSGVAVEVNNSNVFYTAVKTDPTLLGLSSTASTAEVDNLVNWMRGLDSYDEDFDSSTTDVRWSFGDPLHSRSVPITYGGSSSDPIVNLFVGSNDGTIRMINNKTGAEEWAFIPQELYSIQNKLSQDADNDHIYGMDNSPSIWIRDIDGDGIIEPGDGDKVFMYMTMRRGGSNVYAFDATPGSTITNHTTTFVPKLMWVIKGGSGDFAYLAQTWSTPRIARVRFKCSGTECDDGNPITNDSNSRVVLMFAGGYDPHQDIAIPAGPDSIGNAIYMVDPFTGARIWWAGPSGSGATMSLTQMKYSIPSDLMLVDTDGDGNRDRIYVGDTGGQLWRIDLGKNLALNTNGAGTVGYVFADVGCAGGTRTDDCTATSAQNRRKFLYPPEVAPIRDTVYSDSPNYDLIAVGSGDREDPLDLLTTNLSPPLSREAAHNRIYVFRDYNYQTGTPAVVPSPIVDSSTVMYDATADLLSTLTGAALQTEINKMKTSKGWYIDLRSAAALTVPNGLTTQWIGEKVLAKATVLDGILYMTSFTPANDTNATTGCDANAGVATEYVIDAVSSKGALATPTGTARSTVVGGGIPSEVVIIFRPDGTSGVISGGGKGGAPVEAKGVSTNTAQRHYWSED
jgi:type IV pilus assembly protein PilY1